MFDFKNNTIIYNLLVDMNMLQRKEDVYKFTLVTICVTIFNLICLQIITKVLFGTNFNMWVSPVALLLVPTSYNSFFSKDIKTWFREVFIIYHFHLLRFFSLPAATSKQDINGLCAMMEYEHRVVYVKELIEVVRGVTIEFEGNIIPIGDQNESLEALRKKLMNPDHRILLSIYKQEVPYVINMMLYYSYLKYVIMDNNMLNKIRDTPGYSRIQSHIESYGI